MLNVIRAIVLTVVVMLIGIKTEAQERYYPTPDNKPKVRMEMGVGLDAVITGIKSVSTQAVTLNPRLGYGAHFDMALCIGRHFAIEAEVGYQRGKIKAQDARNTYAIKTRTIDVPILLSLRVANQHIRINAGPVFTVMSKAQYMFNNETMEYGPVYPTWNIMGSIGFCIGRHFLLEARYIHALKSTYNQVEGVEFTARPHRISAGFTVLF